MSNTVQDGALPPLEEKEILGTPKAKHKKKTKASKLLLVLFLIFGFIVILSGIILFSKGITKNKAEQEEKALAKKDNSTPSYKNKEAPVEDADLEKLKAAIQKKAQEEQEAKAANANNQDNHFTGSNQSAEQTPFDRKMTGGFLINNDGSNSGGGSNSSAAYQNTSSSARESYSEQNDVQARLNMAGIGGQSSEPNMATRLKPTVLESRQAGFLPNEDYLLKKGMKIPCVLETGIDTTLPSFVICKTISETFSSNGTTLLVDRGATVYGEIGGALKQGQARTFVAWGRIDTNGVTLNIDSPATDRMGYGGIPGEVDTHFGARFGGALMVSFIRDMSQAATQRNSSNNGPTYNTTTSTAGDMASEALRNSVNIPPTLRVNPGTVVEILVSRDVSFENVYRVAH